MQGDLHRAKVKDYDRKRDRHNSVSKLLSGVDEMRLHEDTYEKYGVDESNVRLDCLICNCQCS